MIALTNDLPRKSSRTRTHAISVPATAFVRATRAETTSVSLSAATASGALIAAQNPDEPSAREAQTSAAIGSPTMTVRKTVMKPRERAVPALSLVSLLMSCPITGAR
jgi:hypothetical protein